MTDDEINQLTDLIIGCGIEVHKALGAGHTGGKFHHCRAESSQAFTTFIYPKSSRI